MHRGYISVRSSMLLVCILTALALTACGPGTLVAGLEPTPTVTPLPTPVVHRYMNNEYGFTFRYPETRTLKEKDLITYVNDDYRLAFIYPSNWELEEVPGGESATAIHLTQGRLRLAIQFKRVEEATVLGPSGRPAGQIEERGTVTVLGRAIPRQVLVYGGKVKSVFLGGRFDDLELYAQLDAGVEAEIDFDAIEIPESAQSTLESILSSVTRTGELHSSAADIPTAQATETPTHTPTREPIPTFPHPPTTTPSPFTLSLETYEGEGFSFQYPANARLKSVAPTRSAWQVVSPATAEIHVIGPPVWVKPGDAAWAYRGPAYELIARTYENPKALDAESWARDHILASWQEARDRGRPWGSLPVSEEGDVDEDRVGRSIVAGQPAFWVSYFGFDSSIRAYHLTVDQKVLEVRFRLHPLENQPLATVQEDIYALVLGTFCLGPK
ncbi:MAG: hypothetical protein PVH80_05635 [Anaerolineae bacterium]|jgi:hypothetical protein